VDVAVAGEGSVLPNLLEVLLAIRGGGESVLMTCLRGRNGGRLDDIPGLAYTRSNRAVLWQLPRRGMGNRQSVATEARDRISPTLPRRLCSCVGLR
jgi:hypothetical protein